jgi:hypothetical protein
VADDTLERDEMERLMNALAETVAEASSEEVLEDVRIRGGNPTLVAMRTRSQMEQVVKAFKMRTALEAYERKVEAFKQRPNKLPESIEEKRRLLSSLLASRPTLQSAFTLQFRESDGRGEEALTDEEVESFLRQLLELGFSHDPMGGPRGS